MAAGLLGKRLILLNTDPTITAKNDTRGFEGRGFIDPQFATRPTAFCAFPISRRSDLWVVDQQRIRLLKGFGINNERVDAFARRGGLPIADRPNDSRFTSGYDCPIVSISAPNGRLAGLAAQTALDAAAVRRVLPRSDAALSVWNRAPIPMSKPRRRTF